MKIIYVKNNTNKLCIKEILFELIVLSTKRQTKKHVKMEKIIVIKKC